MKKKLQIFIVLTITLFLYCPNSFAATINGVGLTRIQALDPITSKNMDVAAFYSSLQSNETMAVGPYDISAAKDTPVAPGAYPVVVVSHGSSGSLWGHHDLAAYLARAGFIVITVTHPKDNYLDSSGAGTTSTVYGRPLQISAVIDAALATPFLAPHINKDHLAFIGFSAGGQTGLLLAGATPDFNRLRNYCASRPGIPLCENQGEIQINTPALPPMSDARIKAQVLMAPLC